MTNLGESDINIVNVESWNFVEKEVFKAHVTFVKGNNTAKKFAGITTKDAVTKSSETILY
jgi:hypothetical protein